VEYARRKESGYQKKTLQPEKGRKKLKGNEKERILHMQKEALNVLLKAKKKGGGPNLHSTIKGKK